MADVGHKAGQLLDQTREPHHEAEELGARGHAQPEAEIASTLLELRRAALDNITADVVVTEMKKEPEDNAPVCGEVVAEDLHGQREEGMIAAKANMLKQTGVQSLPMPGSAVFTNVGVGSGQHGGFSGKKRKPGEDAEDMQHASAAVPGAHGEHLIDGQEGLNRGSPGGSNGAALRRAPPRLASAEALGSWRNASEPVPNRGERSADRLLSRRLQHLGNAEPDSSGEHPGAGNSGAGPWPASGSGPREGSGGGGGGETPPSAKRPHISMQLQLQQQGAQQGAGVPPSPPGHGQGAPSGSGLNGAGAPRGSDRLHAMMGLPADGQAGGGSSSGERQPLYGAGGGKGEYVGRGDSPGRQEDKEAPGHPGNRPWPEPPDGSAGGAQRGGGARGPLRLSRRAASPSPLGHQSDPGSDPGSPSAWPRSPRRAAMEAAALAAAARATDDAGGAAAAAGVGGEEGAGAAGAGRTGSVIALLHMLAIQQQQQQQQQQAARAAAMGGRGAARQERANGRAAGAGAEALEEEAYAQPHQQPYADQPHRTTRPLSGSHPRALRVPQQQAGDPRAGDGDDPAPHGGLPAGRTANGGGALHRQLSRSVSDARDAMEAEADPMAMDRGPLYRSTSGLPDLGSGTYRTAGRQRPGSGHGYTARAAAGGGGGAGRYGTVAGSGGGGSPAEGGALEAAAADGPGRPSDSYSNGHDAAAAALAGGGGDPARVYASLATIERKLALQEQRLIFELQQVRLMQKLLHVKQMKQRVQEAMRSKERGEPWVGPGSPEEADADVVGAAAGPGPLRSHSDLAELSQLRAVSDPAMGAGLGMGAGMGGVSAMGAGAAAQLLRELQLQHAQQQQQRGLAHRGPGPLHQEGDVDMEDGSGHGEGVGELQGGGRAAGTGGAYHPQLPLARGNSADVYSSGDGEGLAGGSQPPGSSGRLLSFMAAMAAGQGDRRDARDGRALPPQQQQQQQRGRSESGGGQHVYDRQADARMLAQHILRQQQQQQPPAGRAAPDRSWGPDGNGINGNGGGSLQHGGRPLYRQDSTGGRQDSGSHGGQGPTHGSRGQGSQGRQPAWQQHPDQEGLQAPERGAGGGGSRG